MSTSSKPSKQDNNLSQHHYVSSPCDVETRKLVRDINFPNSFHTCVPDIVQLKSIAPDNQDNSIFFNLKTVSLSSVRGTTWKRSEKADVVSLQHKKIYCLDRDCFWINSGQPRTTSTPATKDFIFSQLCC